MEKFVMVLCLSVTCLLSGLVGGYWLGKNDHPPVCNCRADSEQTQPVRPPHIHGSPVGSPGK